MASYLETLPPGVRSQIYGLTGQSGLRETNRFLRDDISNDCEYYTKDLCTTETPEICTKECKGAFYKMKAQAEKFFANGKVGSLLPNEIKFSGSDDYHSAEIIFAQTFYEKPYDIIAAVRGWDTSPLKIAWDKIYDRKPAGTMKCKYPGSHELVYTASLSMEELENVFKVYEADFTFKIYAIDQNFAEPDDHLGYYYLQYYIGSNPVIVLPEDQESLENLAHRV